MLEGIIQIGQAVLNEGDLLSSIIQELDPVKKKKQQHVVKINFNIKERKLEIDALEEVDSKTAEKYLFIGSADGPRSDQWFASSVSSNYHLSETIYNLTKLKFEGELGSNLTKILEQYYVDIGNDVAAKYRYTLDLKNMVFQRKAIKSYMNNAKVKRTAVRNY